MPKLLIKSGNKYLPECEYIFKYIVNNIFGLEFDLEENDGRCIEIIQPTEKSHKKLVLANNLFQTKDSDWLTPDSLPKLPLRNWENLPDNLDLKYLNKNLPIIYGGLLDNGSVFKIEKDKTELGLDIFGSAFFMLTRYEELVTETRDMHDRFPLSATLSYKEKFHDIPIVNCYIELLWHFMKQLWKGLERKKRDFRIIISYDIDNPLSYAWQTFGTTLRATAGDLIKRKNIKTAVKRLSVYTMSSGRYFNRQSNVSERLLALDPGYNLDWIMDMSEEHNLKGCFNFIAGHSGGEIDGSYYLKWDWIKDLLRQVNQRGHEIGLHPSYNSFNDVAVIRSEFNYIQQICMDMGIEQAKWGGRQHYLRWSNPETWQNWDEAGLNYDSSVGFAENPGFRSGICYEYPVFNLLTKTQLKLTERPLIFMDASVLDYMKCSQSFLAEEAIRFSRIVRRFNGDFTILFHNCRLATDEAKSTFSDILTEIT